MEYDRAARKRLGRAIRAARRSAGYGNRADFADKMRRSTRQVQALENGEDGVGPDTWAIAAEVLGWDLEQVYAILDGDEPSRADRSVPDALARASVEDLAAEVLRRMKGAGHGGDTAPMKSAPSGTGLTEEERERAREAARAAERVVSSADREPPMQGGKSTA